MNESAIKFYNMSVNRLVDSIKETLDDKLAKAYTKIVYNNIWLEDGYFMSPIVYDHEYKRSPDEIKKFVNDVNAKIKESYPNLTISKCEVKYKLTDCRFRDTKERLIVDALQFEIIFNTIKERQQCVCS